MSQFKVVNPVIIGNFKDTYDAGVGIDAAKQFWSELTTDNKYITNNVPQFAFTLQHGGNKSLHHFIVKEKALSDNSKFADFSINEITVDLSKDQTKNFLNEVQKIKLQMSNQAGGKKHRKRYNEDDSSSSSSSSDEDDVLDYIRLRKFNQPITYWWYTPTMYKLDTIFTPTFTTPLVPYVQLYIPLR